MNKNKKGFTLVEMLAAIGILLLITILTYPSFNKLNKKTEEKFDYSIKTIVENAAKIYVDNNKELIIFRDSFGSSITPLILTGYSKVTLVDTRYMSPKLINQYIKFANQDILFMYSTLIINNSSSLKN